ncbi:MAG: hypothetical protein HOQ24_04800 [Mycobacteriaceae bacterium]|nr:hypothetical protein [Mycobacteriaceae bacterium]
MGSRLRLIAAVMAVTAVCGAGVVEAQPTLGSSAPPPGPVLTPWPGGRIRIDAPVGVPWRCSGMSFGAPYLAGQQWVMGPTPIFLQFTTGVDVLVTCATPRTLRSTENWIYNRQVVKPG